MNDIILYSTIIHICNKNNYKLLKFFLLENLRKKIKKNKFLIIIFMSNKIKNKTDLYNFLEKFIKNNYKKIIKHYIN